MFIIHCYLQQYAVLTGTLNCVATVLHNNEQDCVCMETANILLLHVIVNFPERRDVSAVTQMQIHHHHHHHHHFMD
jgi:hypothetical protein